MRPFRFSGHLYGRMISAPTIIIFYLHSVGDGVPDVPLITEIAHGAARTPPPTITNFYPHRRGAFRAPISFSRTSARADDIRPYDYNFLSAFCRGRRPRRPVNYRNRPWGGEGATLQLPILICTVGAHSVRPFRFPGHLHGRMISAPTIINFYPHSVGDGVPDVPLITEIAHGAARAPPPTITNFYPHRRGAFRAPIWFFGHLHGRIISAPTIIIFYPHSVGAAFGSPG